jgi:flagellar L-ring protein precursor FlgH
MKSSRNFALFGLSGFLLTGAALAADLYKAQSYSPLTSDRRALKLGDLVTIVVMENSDASNSTDTSTDKNSAISASIGSLASGRQVGGNVNFADGYGGHGSVQRTGRMVAQLTVSVQEILPNGDLMVKGAQEIDVHGEKTNLRLSGRLRRADIAQNNTAVSSRLADAKIEYVGGGVLTEKAQPGLVSRIWTWLGL